MMRSPTDTWRAPETTCVICTRQNCGVPSEPDGAGYVNGVSGVDPRHPRHQDPYCASCGCTSVRLLRSAGKR